MAKAKQRKKRQSPVTVGFVALGCPKNVVDSERMLADIVQAGFLIAAEPSQADVVIVNTCGFIEPAQVESLEAIREALANKRVGNVRKVIVAGCLPERLGEALLGQAEGVDAVVGLGHRDDIVGIIRETLSARSSGLYLGTSSAAVTDDRVRLRIGPSHWAYLRVSEGCDHRCSFCTIPAIRGPFRSKDPEVILDEARELVGFGAVELNLVGQDTTRYGRDLKMVDGLAALLQRLEDLEGLTWLRLLYAYPRGITERLVETMAAGTKIVPYLDVPIQHVSDKILRAMRRPDTVVALRKMIERLREALPEIVLRTTVIVGFPGETDSDFAELMEFLRWAQFDALGAFTYFAERDTPAAEFPDQVPEELRQARFDELMQAQQAIAFSKNEARIGRRITCLVDAVDGDRVGQGRFYGQAPDIDGICIVPNCSAEPGQFIEARVTGTQDYDLVVEQI